jgi:hypothetical protein
MALLLPMSPKLIFPSRRSPFAAPSQTLDFISSLEMLPPGRNLKSWVKITRKLADWASNSSDFGQITQLED